MHLKSLTAIAVLSLGLVPAFSATAPAPDSAPGKTESQLIAQARASYPLKACIVSDEPLGSMGEAVAYVHRAAGEPDRVFFLCCDGCIDDFKGDPAKYLKKWDDAVAKAAKEKSASAKTAPAK